MLSQTNKNSVRRLPRFVLIVILVGWICGIIIVVLHRQAILDWYRLRGYVPPSSITLLANEDTMTPTTRHLFYLNRPQVLSSVASFRTNCPENKDTIVLGCYHPDQNGIFIYAVNDPALSGVQQVTAAHEVLHAVYARLSNVDRTSLDNELQSFYASGKFNATVAAEIKLYIQTEPNDVYDEMSCTFGTEVTTLSPSLEAYYKTYFSNRAVIVGHEQNYETAFNSKQAQIDAYDQNLTSMKTQIDTLQSQLTLSLKSLNSSAATLDSLKASGDVSAYNAGVAPYNQLVDAYNAQIQTLSNLIQQYNQLVVTRNAVAGQYTTLTSAIDTRITPQQQTSP